MAVSRGGARQLGNPAKLQGSLAWQRALLKQPTHKSRHSATAPPRGAHGHTHLELWVGLGQLRVQHAEGAALLGGLRPQLSPQPGRIDGLLLLQPVFACAEVAAIQGCDPGQGVTKALDRMVLERGQPSISCQVHSRQPYRPAPMRNTPATRPTCNALSKLGLSSKNPAAKASWNGSLSGVAPGPLSAMATSMNACADVQG